MISKKVKLFPAQKYNQYMGDYNKSSMRDEPDHFIVHVGTNDLNSEVPSNSVAESILDLTMPLKTKTNDICF